MIDSKKKERKERKGEAGAEMVLLTGPLKPASWVTMRHRMDRSNRVRQNSQATRWREALSPRSFSSFSQSPASLQTHTKGAQLAWTTDHLSSISHVQKDPNDPIQVVAVLYLIVAARRPTMIFKVSKCPGPSGINVLARLSLNSCLKLRETVLYDFLLAQTVNSWSPTVTVMSGDFRENRSLSYQPIRVCV